MRRCRHILSCDFLNFWVNGPIVVIIITSWVYLVNILFILTCKVNDPPPPLEKSRYFFGSKNCAMYWNEWKINFAIIWFLAFEIWSILHSTFVVNRSGTKTNFREKKLYQGVRDIFKFLFELLCCMLRVYVE